MPQAHLVRSPAWRLPVGGYRVVYEIDDDRVAVVVINIAHRFAAAFHSRDVDRVLDCFTPDAMYDDLFYGRFSGRPGLRALFERMYAEGEHHEWTMARVVRDAESTTAEWRFTFTTSATLPRGGGRTLTFRGVSIFETRAGRCHTYREYFDRGAALLALGIEPAAVARITAARRSVEVTLPASCSA